ncbi:MAG: phage holin family protein [Actinomycetota bacterium]|nr:phage holin family protein [Actinomycetota bacterium]
MSTSVRHRAPAQDPPTLGRLVADASRDISSLIHAEIALAKSELKISLRIGGIGAALLGGAAFLGVLVVILFSVTVAYFIHWGGDGLALHWAFLIVTVFYLLVAALLALVGIRKIKQVRAPDRTIATAKELPKALKGHG